MKYENIIKLSKEEISKLSDKELQEVERVLSLYEEEQIALLAKERLNKDNGVRYTMEDFKRLLNKED